MIEYTKEAKRIPSEAFAFLAGVLNLFSENMEEVCVGSPIPSFSSSGKFEELKRLRKSVIKFFKSSEAKTADFTLSLEREKISSNSSPSAIILSVLQLVQKSVEYYADSMNTAETEAFDQVTRALLHLSPSSKSSKLPRKIVKELKKTVDAMSEKLHMGEARHPLRRRSAAKASDLAIETLAPRMEDPTKYAMGKDKDKTRVQADKDKARREYKRERKAVSRELRLDAAFIESERRKEKERKDTKSREARNKNFGWLEQEQATMNQQVAQGGGLLAGGGMGAARNKAKSGKLGIKRGGKF